MGLQSQNNILAGTSLARVQIQSPNYVPNVSGWAIFQNGNVEFNSGTFRGHVVAGDMFIYTGTPAFGNPPIMWMTNSTTDPFGNALIQKGIGVQTAAGKWAILNGGSLFLGTIGQPFANGALVDESSTGVLELLSGISAVIGDFNSSVQLLSNAANGGLGGLVQVLNAALSSTAGTASNPSVITTDTWHAMTLLNSWANVAGFATARYRMTPTNGVEVIAAISAAAATASTFFTLPAAYRPASQQPIGGAGASGNVPAGLAPWCRCDTAGNLTVQNTGAVGAAWQFFVHGFISLDA